MIKIHLLKYVKLFTYINTLIVVLIVYLVKVARFLTHRETLVRGKDCRSGQTESRVSAGGTNEYCSGPCLRGFRVKTKYLLIDLTNSGDCLLFNSLQLIQNKLNQLKEKKGFRFSRIL